ncbi:Hypothetical predicted protein [Paramuricea clavata]|uniref:Uncharacterized protein n=2 Tax=Paramuricea clavata TaxID=317549 RepID=A0A7D9JGH5_PARCT|nr:Hypothetical predicted protein [Paramuricea clavata]
MFNPNDLQFHLNNALQRIQQLESASISPINNQSSTNSSGNSGLTVTEELRRSFPSLANLRPNHTSSPTLSCSTNPTTSSTQMLLTRASTSGFGANKKKRKRGSTPKLNIKPKAAHKDLVLVPDPVQTSVPTHSSRVMLESDGYVLHSFPFVRDWDDIHLKKEIEKVFPQIQCCGYEYMKALYGKLVSPNLAPGVRMNCNMLLKLSGQGAVYIRSNVKLASGSDSDHSDNDDFLEPSIAAVKQDPEILEIPSESDIEDHVTVEHTNGITEPFAESTPLIDIFDEQNHDNAHRLTTEAGVIDLNHIVNYPVKAVTVHRTTLKNDMIQLFQDPDTLGSLLMFTVIGFDGSAEKGEGVGVARDVLTSFWQVFVDSLAVGVQEKVPSIRHDHQKMQWVAIVRILIYGYLREKYFPISLSLVFVATCLFEEESLTNHDLLQSFRMYISDDERETFDKCCNGELSPDDEEVLELLKVLKEMYDEKRPSSRKVIKLLKCVPANDAENQCLDHLKRYIKSLQGQSLTRFLQFTTGSDIIVTEQIKVDFVAAQGKPVRLC